MPKSWHNMAKRTTVDFVSVLTLCKVMQVCKPESISGCHLIGPGIPNSLLTSGKTTFRASTFLKTKMNCSGFSVVSAFCNSKNTLSGVSSANSPEFAIFRINSRVSSAILKPK